MSDIQMEFIDDIVLVKYLESIGIDYIHIAKNTNKTFACYRQSEELQKAIYKYNRLKSFSKNARY